MEPIESSIEELPVQDLQLCARCYLVIWRDEAGFQFRQGVQMLKDARGVILHHLVVNDLQIYGASSGPASKLSPRFGRGHQIALHPIGEN